jgi:hypothetical protein
MKLGVIYKDGKIINHRSLLKVIFNPIFRYFGFCIGTNCKNNKLKGLEIIKNERKKIKWEKYDSDYDYIIKKRRVI